VTSPEGSGGWEDASSTFAIHLLQVTPASLPVTPRGECLPALMKAS